MKVIIEYECEICGKKSSDFNEIEKCEMEHCGITKYDVAEYERLYRDMMDCLTRKSVTVVDYDESVKRIAEFEKEHPKLAEYMELAGHYKYR